MSPPDVADAWERIAQVREEMLERLLEFKSDMAEDMIEIKADIKGLDKKVSNELTHRLPRWATFILSLCSAVITGLIVYTVGQGG